MNGFLLDTNVPSELARPRPATSVVAWLERTPREAAHLSVISIAELIHGVARHPDPARRIRMGGWTDAYLRQWFASQILPVTKPIAERAGRIMGDESRVGRTLSIADALIAATAIEHNLILVTRNTKDFVNLGMELFDPWNGGLL